MSIGGQQEALRRERDKLAEDYKKLGVKHANALKERDELRTIRDDMLNRARKAEKQVEELEISNRKLEDAANSAIKTAERRGEERDSANQNARRLLLIITNHRDQRGDDRCWLDDQDMYTAAGLAPANTALPPAEEFAANCKRFHQSRQRPGDKYETVAEMVEKKRVETLEAAIVEMKAWGGRFEFDGHAETAEEILRKLIEKKP